MESQMNRLKEETNIRVVIEALGITTEKKGQNYFLHCPDPEHHDQHPSAYFRDGWNNVYCNSCNRAFKAIDIIMMQTGCDLETAGNFLWELQGRPDWYAATNKAKESFSLTTKEAGLIGLRLHGKAKCCVSFQEFKSNLESGQSYHPSEIDGYLKIQEVRINWKDFMSELEYLEIVMRKAEEASQIYHKFNLPKREEVSLKILERAKKYYRLKVKKRVA